VFIDDKPITSTNDDMLGRSHFANLIADAALGMDGCESFVIGLYGDWGSGKTSIANLAVDEIRKRTRGGPKQAVVVRYNPWACSAGDELQYQFFVQLASDLSRMDGVKRAGKKLAQLVLEYGDAISLAGPEAAAVRAATVPVFKRLTADADIVSLRIAIEKKLEKISKRVIVVIDDVDRLTREQIGSVFQLVSAVADFKSTVFILPFDYGVVVRALDYVQGRGVEGASYLSKIVQIPLSVPQPKMSEIRSGVERMIERSMGELSEEEAAMVRQIVGDVVMPYVKTMRDAKRLANSFAFASFAIGAELNKADLLALSALQAFDPGFYDFVQSNRKLLCEHEYLPRDETEAFGQELGRAISKWFVEDARNEHRLAVLSVLFPKVAYSGRLWSQDRDRKWRRLACPEYFDAYFSLSYADIDVSRSSVYALMEGSEGADNIIENALANQHYIALLDELVVRVDDLSEGRRRSLLLQLFAQFGKSSETASAAIFSLTADNATESAIRALLGGLDMEDADDAVCRAIEAADLDNLIGMSHFINSLELAHGRLASDGKDPDRQYISANGLDAVEASIAKGWRRFAKDSVGFLQHGSRLHMLLYLVSNFDSEGYDAFWREALASDPIAYAYVSVCFAMQWSSSAGDFGWTFDNEGIKRIVDEGVLCHHLEELLEGGALKGRLSEVERCMVVAYRERPNATVSNDEALSFRQAKKLLAKWER